jgi:hypothetical protein
MLEKKEKKKPWRALAGAAIVLSVAAIAGQSVLSSLNATAFNTSPQNVNSGTMSLNLSATNPSVGFSQSVTNLAPGDVINRYVTLTNDGSLDGKDLTLQTTETGTATLISDIGTSKALTLTVSSCNVAWSGGTCSSPSGGSQEVTGVLGTFSTAKLFANAAMSSGAVKYLQISLKLPDQNETTANGVPPTPTIQGGNVYITYTFDLAQRLATTINS